MAPRRWRSSGRDRGVRTGHPPRRRAHRASPGRPLAALGDHASARVFLTLGSEKKLLASAAAGRPPREVLGNGWLVAVDGRLEYHEWETDEGSKGHD
jgi:hypothetical protein